MQTLKINIPDGFVIDKFNEQTGEVSFKPKAKLPAMQRIKTVNDVLIDNNINPDDFTDENANLTADEKAYKIIKLIAKSLNEGWTPNWNNNNEYKDSNSNVGSRLCFKSRDLAEYAANQFTDVYKQFMTL